MVTYWSGRRAELNGLEGKAFAQYVRDKLTEAGVEKMIPQDETLEQAYRRADRIHRLNSAVEEALQELQEVEVEIPEDLRERVEEYLADNPLASWDDAMAEIADQLDGEAA